MIESRCGLLCSHCSYRGEMCLGCTNIDKPFWADTCPGKACWESKQHTHCGQCAAFPCALLHQFAYDMQESDNGQRIVQCRIWCEASR